MVVKGEFDRPLFVIIILLLCFGSIMVFSASYAYAYSDLDDSSYYIRRQMIFAALGIVAMLGISFISYKLIRKFTMLIYFVSIVLLILVLVIGISDGEAKRWLGYGSATFQPSEVAKFALVLILALFFEKHRRATLMRDYSISTYIKSFSIGTIIPFAIIMISCVLVLAEKHLSGTIILLGLGVAVMWAGGSKKSFFAFLFIAVCIVFALIIFKPDLFKDKLLHGYQWKRIDMWLHPELYDPQSDTWQTDQGLIAVGSGGIWGRGLGNSLQKHLFISQPQNDFIFAVLCEELGLLGAFSLIVLYMVFFVRCLHIARRAPDVFSSLTVVGIASHVLIQALLNMMVVTAMIPNTGISLPFFSYGGSSLLILMCEMGVILSISRYARIQK
jgi:cell division protein FtsW